MQTFQDMIKAGVAPSRHQDYLPELPSTDQLVRHYNTYWGAVTDTHMIDVADCYIITGSRVNRKELFRALLTADHWEDLRFPSSFAYIMMKKGLCGTSAPINGQLAFVISKWDKEEPNPVFLEDVNEVYVPATMNRFVPRTPQTKGDA